MHELHEVLTAPDTDGSGEVSRTEFAAALPTPTVGARGDAADLAVLFDSLDPDSSGTINWREVYLTLGKSNKNELRGGELRKDVSKVFAKKGETLLADTSTATEAVTRLREALFENRQRVMALFLEWDVDGDSVVSKKEFRRGLSVLGFQTPNGRADVDALFDTFDPDGSGAIEYNELRRLLQAAPSAGGASTWRATGAAAAEARRRRPQVAAERRRQEARTSQGRAGRRQPPPPKARRRRRRRWPPPPLPRHDAPTRKPPTLALPEAAPAKREWNAAKAPPPAPPMTMQAPALPVGGIAVPAAPAPAARRRGGWSEPAARCARAMQRRAAEARCSRRTRRRGARQTADALKEVDRVLASTKYTAEDLGAGDAVRVRGGRRPAHLMPTAATAVCE